MKRFLYILALLPLPLWAETSVLTQMLEDLRALGSTPTIEVDVPPYTKIRLADSCYAEVYQYTDSILFIQTVCSPLCSSVARMYDTEWRFLHAVPAPANYTLPQASVDEKGVLTWHENYADVTDSLQEPADTTRKDD